MVHVLERHHNDRFMALMDQFLPQWRIYREELIRSPLAYVEWSYRIKYLSFVKFHKKRV